MLDAFFGWPFIITFIVLMIFGFFFGSRREKRYRQAWRSFAERHGLEFRAGHRQHWALSLSGEFRGHAVVVERVVVSSGESSTAYTDYTVRLHPAWKTGMAMRYWKFRDRIAEVFRGQDGHTVGDEDFDARFTIRGPVSVPVARALEQPEVQEVLLEMGSKMTIEGGALTLRTPGTPESAVEIEDILNRVCDRVEVLNGTTGQFLPS